MNTIVTNNRISYILGLVGHALLLPWPPGSKGVRRRWKHLQLSDMDEGSHLAKLATAGNIGVALGKVSNGLVTIDLDHDSFVDAFLEANPLLRRTLRTHGSRGCNIWIRCSGEYPPSQKLKNSRGDDIGEWRADGNQTIIAGIHPEGMPYEFVIPEPAITVSYDALIWPDSILPPHATESKRVRGVRENKVVSVCVPSASFVLLERFSNGDLIFQVAPKDFHQNNDSLFRLARLLVDYASAVGRPANDAERLLVFDHWCLVSRPFWRPGLTREDYWTEFLQACYYARFGLNQNPLELALHRAGGTPLPVVSGFSDERVRLLAAICREMHQLVGGNTFYLPTREVGKLLGAHYTNVARWLVAFETLGLIHLAPGEVRRRGVKRSPRYHCGSRAACLACGKAEALSIAPGARLPALPYRKDEKVNAEAPEPVATEAAGYNGEL